MNGMVVHAKTAGK